MSNWSGLFTELAQYFLKFIILIAAAIGGVYAGKCLRKRKKEKESKGE